MLKKSIGILALVLIVVLAACSGGGKQSASSGEIVLKVTGNVNNETGWTEDDLRAMDTLESSYTNKDGETTTYTGVSINALLEKAGVKGDATAVAFVADDGYSAEATLAEVQGCANCIIGFRDEGGLIVVMPDFSSKLQVKDVIEIQVK